MLKRLARTLSKKCSNREKELTPWDQAISEAQRQMEEARQRYASLSYSIKTFETLRDDGAPFPGTSESSEGTYGSASTYGAKPDDSTIRRFDDSTIRRLTIGRLANAVGGGLILLLILHVNESVRVSVTMVLLTSATSSEIMPRTKIFSE